MHHTIYNKSPVGKQSRPEAQCYSSMHDQTHRAPHIGERVKASAVEVVDTRPADPDLEGVQMVRESA